MNRTRVFAEPKSMTIDRRISCVIVLGKDKSCFIGLDRRIRCGGIGLSECKRCHSEDGFETFAEILGR